MTTYVIEHLEPRIWKWCLIEYKSISNLVGKNNLWFTNVKRKNKSLEKLGRVIKESVKALALKNACILDPEAGKILSPEEAKSFDYLIFGGILGDYPPKKRTRDELTKFIPNTQARSMGNKQLSTDNAVFVAKEIVGGKSLNDIKFQDNIAIKINEIESTELPYSYPLVNGKPRISGELVKFLKRKRGM